MPNQDSEEQSPTALEQPEPGAVRVRQGNPIIEAAQRLSVVGKRGWLMLVSKYNPHKPPHQTIRITGQEWEEVYPTTGKRGYEACKAFADEMGSSTIEVPRKVDSRTGHKLVYDKYPWLAKATYHEGKGYVELRFNYSELGQYLYNVHKNYTEFQLKHVAPLRSAYGIRLYEMFRRHWDTGWWDVPIEKFRRLLGIQEGKYKRFSHLNDRVIKIAIADLEQRANLDIKVTHKKKGRQVDRLRFEFKENPQGKLEL